MSHFVSQLGGMTHMKVFSRVYCDRVYILCAERFETGSGFDPPPPQRHPPTQLKVELPPPPPPEESICHSIANVIKSFR